MNFVRTRITKSLLAEQCSHSLMRNGRLVVGRKMPVVIPLRSVSHLMIRNDRVFSRSQAPCRGLSADAEKAAEAPKVEIADDSWAAEGLAKQGEKLASSADKPMVLIDDELIQGPPSATAKKLCDEILALNVVEVHQLLQLIQVGTNHHPLSRSCCPVRRSLHIFFFPVQSSYPNIHLVTTWN